MTARPPFPFIVACGRSGTTLVRAILDSHPDMAIPPETHFILSMLVRRRRYERDGHFAVEPFKAELERRGLRRLGLSTKDVVADLAALEPLDTPDAIRRVFSLYAARRGKARYGNKTPVHVLSVATLADAFPEARFIHVIRAGREVALSYLDIDIGPQTVAAAAMRWRRWVNRGRADGHTLGLARYLEVRYEHLLADPRAVTEIMCGFVELPFHPAMLRYYERADDVLGGINRPEYFSGLRLPPTEMRDWRREMAPTDVATFELVAGDLLKELGYQASGTPAGLRARARAFRGKTRAQMARVGHAARIRSRRMVRRFIGTTS
jgi:Sulfotransferase family